MYQQSLRAALGARLGQVLTPELAADIENCARILPDGQNLNPADFRAEVIEHEGEFYVISVEPFERCWGEMHALHEAHWRETEGYRHGVPLRPDYPAFIAMERAGKLLQITIRCRANLVGNLRMYLGTSMHTKQMVATEDTMYLAPEHRNVGWLAIHMVRYAVKCLEQIRDAREFEHVEIITNSKLANHADVIMRRVFGKPVGLMFAKIFTRKESSHVPKLA